MQTRLVNIVKWADRRRILMWAGVAGIFAAAMLGPLLFDLRQIASEVIEWIGNHNTNEEMRVGETHVGRATSERDLGHHQDGWGVLGCGTYVWGNFVEDDGRVYDGAFKKFNC